MERAWYTRLVLVLALIVVASYYAAPSVIYFMSPPEERRSRTAMEERIPDWMPDSRLNLGIDLQGGLHLVMGVDTEKAVQDRADRVADEIVEAMSDAGKPLESARRPAEAPELELVLKGEGDWPQLQETLKDWEETWEVRSRSGNRVYFGMKSSYESQMRDDAVSQALKTLRNRIDAYGVAEPEIRRRGNNSIMIQLAGLTAEEIGDVKQDIIGRTAQLEFKIVDDTSTYFEQIAAASDKPESIQLRVDQWRNAEDAIVNRPYLEATDREELRDFLDATAASWPKTA
jgi:preprotein translocase subunit SecD